MKKLSKPEDIGIDVYRRCISTTNKNKSYYESIIDLIFQAEGEYETKASMNELHLMTNLTANVFHPEHEYLYNSKMLSKKGICREVYDRIMLLAEDSICPLCNQRDVSTLDHHLPKLFNPELSVNPLNLIPSCKDCNHVKLSIKPLSASDETFHPYFDDFGNEHWLMVNIVESFPPSFDFFVDKPASWSQLKYNRTLNHFNIFKLRKLYGVNAGRELNNIKAQLKKLHNSGGEDLVRSHLVESKDSFEDADSNSWQSSMYRAISNSTWFCSNVANF